MISLTLFFGGEFEIFSGKPTPSKKTRLVVCSCEKKSISTKLLQQVLKAKEESPETRFVSFRWFNDSLKKGKLLSFESYLLLANNNNNNISISQQKQDPSRFLSGAVFAISNYADQPVNSMKESIAQYGGKVVEKFDPKNCTHLITRFQMGEDYELVRFLPPSSFLFFSLFPLHLLNGGKKKGQKNKNSDCDSSLAGRLDRCQDLSILQSVSTCNACSNSRQSRHQFHVESCDRSDRIHRKSSI